ncbi:aspartate-semialdehyde dehydrogenase [Acidimicrobiia bacterium]|nr:aspartate-semialdehyde dehydrogenase [Acidimicrobiia bacterium]MDC1070972.1 aspartate-semialdehyde dehydrogenase [Acidimicrobiia bacterium]
MKIAIVGATGLVGRNIIKQCERLLPNDIEFHLFASNKSAGKTLKINNQDVVIKELKSENIGKYDMALFSAGGVRSKAFAENFISQGSYVIDNSSAFRLQEDVPLVVYGINQNEITSSSKLIANPNCTTMGLVMALKPLHDTFNLVSMTPVAYQAVSGSGTAAVNSLKEEESLDHTSLADYKNGYYPRPIARNVIPLAGNLLENEYSDEEMKFVHESRKILDIPKLIVEPSNARVGVITGHGVFCSAVFEEDIDTERAIIELNSFEGVQYWAETLATPLDAENNTDVLVSRLRRGLSSPKIINFWCVSDNLLKGAALNAVQIAKYLVQK